MLFAQPQAKASFFAAVQPTDAGACRPVPSGGGQWAVQGSILVDAAQTLGVSYQKTVLALAYGDQWTNLFQPFWALALLGITGLKARQIMGYAMTVMFIGIVFFLLALLIPA